MRAKKILMNDYEAYLYKTKRYNQLKMSFIFQTEYTKRNIYLLDIIAEYLLHTNKYYKTKKELTKEFRKYYEMDLTINNYNRGEQCFVEIIFKFLDPKLVKDDYLGDALKFAHENIFDINVQGGKLDQEVLKEIKMKMINSKAESLTNPRQICARECIKSFASNTYLTEDMVENIEEFKELLDSYTDEEIIKTYNKILNNCFVNAFLFGNFDNNTIELVKKYFPFKNQKKTIKDRNYLIKFGKYKEVQAVDANIGESTLILIYSINKYKTSDQYKYIAVREFLNSTGMLLHKKLRDEMKLVYNSYASTNLKMGYFTITAYISKNNKGKAIEGIKNVFKQFQNKEFTEDLISKGKRDAAIEYYTMDESSSRMFSRLIEEKMGWEKTINHDKKQYFSIEYDDIIKAVKNLELKEVFFYRGDKE